MKKETGSISRRGFGKSVVGAGALAAAPMIVPSSVLGQAVNQAGQPVGQPGVVAPSDRIIVGGIGLRNRGQQDLAAALADPRVQFVGIADVRESARETIKSAVDRHYGNGNCVIYRDDAELLAREDVEAVMIATSDRWHACMAVWAAQSARTFTARSPPPSPSRKASRWPKMSAVMGWSTRPGASAATSPTSNSRWGWPAAASSANCWPCMPTIGRGPSLRWATAGGPKNGQSPIRWSSIGTSGWVHVRGALITPATRMADGASSGTSMPGFWSGPLTPATSASGPLIATTLTRSSRLTSSH